ncbi:hypothetical protein [Chitinophaga sp. LS1]|uniref:hypothetical protein n=1 Tax=Chitinophaga sp. LS1 TaxID=3051176 RepID=UPI002AAAC102|nr:hypothetical protein [Chitinophaga sp. LS1]WPV66300.1 hypothetical protein QQL36_31370 [Chitinophaga sp. LS1]
MANYELIKKIADAYEDYGHHLYVSSGKAPKFDEWASGPGKELMEQLKCNNCGGTTLRCYDCGKVIASSPKVEQPSNAAPVSTHEDKKECPACGCTEDESNLCAAHYCPFFKETDTDRHEEEQVPKQIPEKEAGKDETL